MTGTPVASSVLLSRKTILTRGGAGQIMASQAQFLQRSGYDVSVCCAKFGHGASEAFSGVRSWCIPRPLNALLPAELRLRLYESRVPQLRAGGLLIDHGESIADADIAYIHNFLSPVYARRMPGYVANERLPWRGSGPGTVLVANSVMVSEALQETLHLSADRVVVIYPGYDSARFNPENRQKLRDISRQELAIGHDEIVVGLITSGNFYKRGLDCFVECFNTLSAGYPALRGLVVGDRGTPSELSSNPDYRRGRIIHRPVTGSPERLMAALDLMLYPARYEEFGIVVLEAMAMGIPIVTSSAVGAAELLGDTCEELVIDAAHDSSDAYCKRTSSWIDSDDVTKRELAAMLSTRARGFSHSGHNVALASVIDSLETRRP